MRSAMFLRLMVLLTIVTAMPVSGKEGNENIVVTNRVEDSAGHVFVGSDSEMPVSDRWMISIQPSLEDGTMVVPTTVPAAIDELAGALPRWYLAALKQSRGEYDCVVSVNGVYVSFAVIAWIRLNWNLDDDLSPLFQELRRLGASNGLEAAEFIHNTICIYSKTDRKSALDALMKAPVNLD